jgi:soluble lytic murein transglycosylase-like protein
MLIWLAGLAVVRPAADAAERVTLSNGFAMVCDHHAQLEDKTRLYLSPGEDDFIEFPAQDVASVENIPGMPAASTVPATNNRKANASLNPADLGEILTHAGQEHNLDVDLLASIVKAESGGNAHAVSRAGAQGLMQLMPGTAAGQGVKDSFEPEQNVRGGSAYLDALLTQYHDNMALALAAYNAGPKAVEKYHGIPPYRETRVYVARVIHEFNRRVLARETAASRQRAANNIPQDTTAR